MADGWRSPLNSDLTQEMIAEAAFLSPPVNHDLLVYNNDSNECIIATEWSKPKVVYHPCLGHYEDQYWIIAQAAGHPGYFNFRSKVFAGQCMQADRTDWKVLLFPYRCYAGNVDYVHSLI